MTPSIDVDSIAASLSGVARALIHAAYHAGYIDGMTQAQVGAQHGAATAAEPDPVDPCAMG